MRAWMLRGQGTGVQVHKVFATYPTEDDFRAALAHELDRHGIAFDKALGTDGLTRVIGGAAKTRWVQIVETEIAGLEGEGTTPPAGARARIVGQLAPDAIAAKVAEAQALGAPGTAKAVGSKIETSGEGKVTNPGDPDYVKSSEKYPGVDMKAREAMAISAADVGVVPAEVLASPPAAK